MAQTRATTSRGRRRLRTRWLMETREPEEPGGSPLVTRTPRLATKCMAGVGTGIAIRVS